MRKHLLSIGLSVGILSSLAGTALAQTPSVTTEPDNGFYQAPNPGWYPVQTTTGTDTHRAYHRAAAQALLLWNADNKTANGTADYAHANRLMRQERNMLHRQFHTEPTNPNPS